MPIVSVLRRILWQEIGEELTDKEFDDLCFRFGLELDDITSEKEMIRKNTGVTKENASEEIIYKIEVPANRYDLLCLEGLSRAIRIYRGKEKPPRYVLKKPETPQKMIIKKEVTTIRPFVSCAILRNLKFTKTNFDSFIDLQDKLHQNICRQRTLASVGTHDLDTIKGPFTYEALPPKDIVFTHLNYHASMNASELMDHLSKDQYLSNYLFLRNEPLYPVIYDSNRVVLSLPPVINGNHSKITLDTKNVFIEVTGTDKTKVNIVLDNIVTVFSQYCEEKFTIEPVLIQNEGGSQEPFLTPDFTPRHLRVEVSYINKAIGISISPSEVQSLLLKMGLEGKLIDNDSALQVEVPPTRADILHACDVMEDAAIAYGYNNIPKTTPTAITIGKQLPLNKLTEALRIQLAILGWTEILTLCLCSREENYKKLNKPEDTKSTVVLLNPEVIEFEIIRTNLLVGLLKALKPNKKHTIPLKLFEISDVVHLDSTKDVGARNKRVLAAIYANTTAGFEVIHGLLDRVMLALDIYPKLHSKQYPNKSLYYIEPSTDESFLPGRCADVYVNDKKVGVFGVLHPIVLKSYGSIYPASALHIYIEDFV
eukprot:TRINITY_DN1590_c0_g1_i1.p1 TRINITY_DN1590_c0_g1~~TRINITY_DN1590_c0_g1_i1.p1  ORF type:complete len:595 (-),score=106.36 TRINITY_DN1590_c0_g1_i1:57-1841(-)